jgi:hypothetical protein
MKTTFSHYSSNGIAVSQLLPIPWWSYHAGPVSIDPSHHSDEAAKLCKVYCQPAKSWPEIELQQDVFELSTKLPKSRGRN